MSYESIPPAEQGNVMGMFWFFLRQAEEDALDTGAAMDRHFVEAGYATWNRATGEDKKPLWMS